MASNWRSLYQANEDAISGNWYRISKVKFNYDDVTSLYPTGSDVYFGVHPAWGFTTTQDEPVMVGLDLEWALRVNPDDASVTMAGEKITYYDNGALEIIKGDTVIAGENEDGDIVITWTEPVYFYGWVTPKDALAGDYKQYNLGGNEKMAERIYVLPEGMEEESKTPAEELTENIQRIQIAKNDIKTAIENKYVTVPEDARIDEYATYINQIPQDYTDAVPWHIVTANDVCYWYDELTIGPEGGEVSLSATAYYDEHQYYGLVGDIKNLVYYRLEDGSTTNYVSTNTFSDLDSNQWNTDPVYSVKNKFIKFNIDPLPDDITERYMQFYIYYTNPANKTTSDKIRIWQRR